jgi:hypothetical protein
MSHPINTTQLAEHLSSRETGSYVAQTLRKLIDYVVFAGDRLRCTSDCRSLNLFNSIIAQYLLLPPLKTPECFLLSITNAAKTFERNRDFVRFACAALQLIGSLIREGKYVEAHITSSYFISYASALKDVEYNKDCVG